MVKLTIELDERTYAVIGVRAMWCGLTIEEEAGEWLTAQVICEGEGFEEVMEVEGLEEANRYMNREVKARRMGIG